MLRQHLATADGRAAHAPRSLGIPSVPSAFLRAAAAIVLLALLAAGCATGSADASFDPSAPCGGVARQQMKGAYPALEARIPASIQGHAAASRDSGRFCSKETLGSLLDAGVTEMRFGGGIWEFGDHGGIQVSAFDGAGLTPALLAEEYKRAAGASQGTSGLKGTTLEIDGRPAWRIDAMNGSSRQAIVVWGSADAAVVQAVVAADVQESDLQAAIDAFR